MKNSINDVRDPKYKNVLTVILEVCKRVFGDDFESLVLFGSVARDEADKKSDIDLIIVHREFPESLSKRIDVLLPVLAEVKKSKEFLFFSPDYPFIQFYPLTIQEAKKSRPIYLDITQDGIILYDKNGVMHNTLNRLKKKLEKLGSKRVFLKDGTWMWVLKPGLKPGEVIEL